MAFTTLRGRTQTSLSEINVTPFVDVMLVLLIIFMITAPLLQSGIEVDLPETRTVKVISQEKVVITVDKGQNLYIGNNAVNYHTLGQEVLKKLQGNAHEPVYIRCDKAVPFGDFALVIDALRQSNVNNINIVTKPLETKGGG